MDGGNIMNELLNKLIGKVMEETGWDYEFVRTLRIEQIEGGFDCEGEIIIPMFDDGETYIDMDNGKVEYDIKNEMIIIKEMSDVPVIVVVETERQQKYFEKHAERNNLPFHVIVKGQSIRGFKYQGYRANTVIMVCDLVTDKEWEWVKNELIPTLDKDYSLLRQ
jgi:hypothetical protein